MNERLALDGGEPVRHGKLPYGRQWIDESDIAAVVEVLRSDRLTTGPKVEAFETALAETVGAAQAVAVSSGTAALHAAMFALGIGQGDEVIVSPMTFAASANCVLYQGGRPIFADVDPDTLLIDPKSVERLITPRTKAVIAVDYAGQPCDYTALRALADKHKLALVSDACHSLGGSLHERNVGTLADLNVFSFHPVKGITTAEGGAITTDDPRLARRLRHFRSHGITTDYVQREKAGSWHYEMVALGYNYRLSDLHCALGLSQLARLDDFIAKRRAIAKRYDEAFAGLPEIAPLALLPGARHAYHLYILRFDLGALTVGRQRLFEAFQAEGIGVNVHYIPVHLHPYYRETQGTAPGLCPVAESVFERILSIPIFPAMSEQDASDVIQAVTKVVGAYGK